MMNVSWRELRSVYGVCNLIIYGAFFFSFAVIIRVRTSFVYVCYGFVSIGYWGTKQQCYHFSHTTVYLVLCLYGVCYGRQTTSTEPPDLCGHVYVCSNESMENRWHRFTLVLVYFGEYISTPSAAHKIQGHASLYMQSAFKIAFVRCII